MDSSGSSGQIALSKRESSSFRDVMDEEHIIEGCVNSWQNAYDERRLKMRAGVEADTCPLMFAFSKQISARIQKSTKKKSNNGKVADDSIPVSVAVFAIKPVYKAVFGKWMLTLKRSFWRTFERIINDRALWSSDDWDCATIFLEKTTIGEIAILHELRSQKKEDLTAYFLNSMFKLMKNLFLKVFFVTREKNEVLVFKRQTWNKLVKNHLKSRIEKGWIQEVSKEKVKSMTKVLSKHGIKIPNFGFIPSGEKFRLVAPLKQHLLRVERPLVIYRDSENMKIRERTASQDEIKEIFSAKLQFIRWIAATDSITSIKSISLPEVLPFMQKIDTSSCVLAKTDVKSAYDGILASKAYNFFLGKLNNFFGELDERDKFRWIFFRKSEQSGKFEYKRKEEICIFDEDEYKCFRLRDIEKLFVFLKQTPIRSGKKCYTTRFLLHSSPLSFPLAELYIKDTLNVAYKKANIPDLQIIQYMDDILIHGQSKEQISTFYDALKPLLPMHALSLEEITFLGYNKNLTTNAVTKKMRRYDPDFTKRMKAPLRERINYFQFLAKNKLNRCLCQKIIIELDEKSTKQVVFAVFQEIARCYNATRKHVHLQNDQIHEFRCPEEFFHKCFRLVDSRLVKNEKRFFKGGDFWKLKRSFLRITSR